MPGVLTMSTEPTRPGSIERGRAIAESMMDHATAEYRQRLAEEGSGTPAAPAVEPVEPQSPSVGGTGSRTGVLKAQRGAEAADVEHGRQIAMTAMDLAEARYRHEHGQPHRHEHCETCAREAVADAAKPGHLREAAASLRTIADHMPDTSSAAELRPGIEYAATLLGHTADDLTDLKGTS
jgi:hypothetical protein